MPVYWIMMVWVLLFTFKYHDAYFDLSCEEPYITASDAVWMLSVPVFFIALRSNCEDTAGYIGHFQSSAASLEEFLKYSDDSFLFWGLSYFVKIITANDGQLWIALIAVIQAVLMSKVLLRYSENYAVSIFVFFASCLFANWMCNGIRQFMAVCILFACTGLLLEGRYVKYIAVVLFVMGFLPIWKALGVEAGMWFFGGIHQSAVILIPIVFCASGEAFNKRTVMAAIAFSIVMMSGLLHPLIGSVASNMAYAGDMANMQADSGSSIFRALVAFVPVAISFVCLREIRLYETPPIIHLSVNMSIFAGFLYIAASLTSGIYVGRLPIYCEMYNLILYPWLLNHPFRNSRSNVFIMLVISYMIYFYYQMHVGFDGLEYGSRVLGIWYW